MKKSVSDKTIYFTLIIAMLGWGFAWTDVKILSTYISFEEVLFYRYLICLLTMVPIIIFINKSFKILLKDIYIVVIGALLFTLYNLVFYYGVKIGTAGIGGAFVTTLVPITTFILTRLIHKNKFTSKDYIGISLGTIGAMTIINIWQFSHNEIINISILYYLICALSFSIFTLVQKESTTPSLVFLFYVYLFGCIVGYVLMNLHPNNIHDIFDFDFTFWFHLLSISIFATTFSTTMYITSTKYIGLRRSSAFIFLTPFFVVIVSFIYANEQIHLMTICGIFLTITATYILNKKPIKPV